MLKAPGETSISVSNVKNELSQGMTQSSNKRSNEGRVARHQLEIQKFPNIEEEESNPYDDKSLSAGRSPLIYKVLGRNPSSLSKNMDYNIVKRQQSKSRCRGDTLKSPLNMTS